ncbi:MAG: GtrA family protein [Pseudomonadota bacterium]
MTLTTLIVRYTAFAVIATVANLAVQRVVLAGLAWEHRLLVAIFFGTLVGLVIKYMLDKRWIFQDLSTGLANHSRQFGLYTLMGVLTTMIFWGFEYSFWVIWQTDPMRELGAVIGLAIGYVTKYNLDRKFVFADIPRTSAP